MNAMIICDRFSCFCGTDIRYRDHSFGDLPVPAVVEPAPSAAAVSPAGGLPCSSAQSGHPAAAPSGRSAG